MSVIDVIRKFAERKKERSEKFKQMQEDDQLQHMLEERRKSSNQRELENYYKKQHEEQIKKQLDVVHKKQRKETWKGKSITKSNYKIMKDERPMLKEKNIFKHKHNNFLTAGGFD